MADVQERRQYKRLHAPVVCRPLGVASSSVSQEVAPLDVQDISLGGVRVYTDDKHVKGERLELELWLPEGESVTLDTQVVWVEALGKDDPALYEVGLRFVDVAKGDLDKLAGVLREP